MKKDYIHMLRHAIKLHFIYMLKTNIELFMFIGVFDLKKHNTTPHVKGGNLIR